MGLIRIREKEMPLFLEDRNKYFKIYHDGTHFVAIHKVKNREKYKGYKPSTKIKELFENAYKQAKTSGICDKDLRTNILYEMSSKMEPDTIFDSIELNNFVKENLITKKKNVNKRKKLFMRKANLNKWNYFITITNGKYEDEELFRQKLKKCLSNFNVRKGWKVMGVFEKAPETKRLHFHAIANIPQKDLINKLAVKKDYSTTKNKMQERVEHSFFSERFGVNDFQNIESISGCIGYILKYITKDEEKIFYSKGIKSEVIKMLGENDIITKYFDFVEKYVLFDEAVDYEFDILEDNTT